MRAHLPHCLLLLAFASTSLYALFVVTVVARMRRFVRPDDPTLRAQVSNDLPAVSILKPCAGADEALEACVESFCHLRHPRFEILCGVREASDPAVPILQRVRARHPEVAFSIVLTEAGISPNPKVAQLEVLAMHAQYDALWISDSNTQVHPDTLASMCEELARPGVGMVLSPVVGTGEKTAGAALENLHLAAFITFFTMALFHLFRRVAAPGKSTLLRRRSLERIGGFEELGRYVAEDYLLVERLRENGERTVLGRHMVANVNTQGTVKRFYDRHFRWTQLHFRAEPLAALLEPLTHPVVAALLWFAVEPSLRALGAVALIAAFEGVCDLYLLAKVRGTGLSAKFALLTLVRPLVFVALWTRASYSRKVVWRGNVRWLGAETLALEEPAIRTRLRQIREAIGASL